MGKAATMLKKRKMNNTWKLANGLEKRGHEEEVNKKTVNKKYARASKPIFIISKEITGRPSYTGIRINFNDVNNKDDNHSY